MTAALPDVGDGDEASIALANGARIRPSVDEALTIIRDAIAPLEPEEIDVPLAAGRVTAQAVLARHDAPRFDAAAMDGYAVSIDPAATFPLDLPVVESIAAGQWTPALSVGTAARISTGAPVPEGAIAILVREAAILRRANGIENLILRSPILPDRNIRRQGEDMREGATILGSGARLTPDAIGALASYGVHRVIVRRRPSLALLSTGSELADPGVRDPRHGSIFDSNGPMIAAAAREAGLAVDFMGSAVDQGHDLRILLEAAIGTSADLVISTGGVSMGDHDHVRDMLEQLGATILFHGVRMRPGKPMLLARLPDGRLYFGLPGNPVAALVAFRFFVVQAARALLGLRPETGEPIDAQLAGRADVTLFLRARRSVDASGEIVVDASLDQRSHILRSVLEADLWIRVDERDGSTVARAFPKAATLD